MNLESVTCNVGYMCIYTCPSLKLFHALVVLLVNYLRLFFFGFCRSSYLTDMVIPPPARAPAITKFLKPYVLKMHFTNNFVSAQVIHTPSATVACAASSQEKGPQAKHGVYA
jgi:hypothetical protein